MIRNKINQSTIIQQEIINCIENYKMTDKTKIFSKVVEKLGVPRPTVRRAARELKIDFHEVIEILDGEIVK